MLDERVLPDLKASIRNADAEAKARTRFRSPAAPRHQDPRRQSRSNGLRNFWHTVWRNGEPARSGPVRPWLQTCPYASLRSLGALLGIHGRAQAPGEGNPCSSCAPPIWARGQEGALLAQVDERRMLSREVTNSRSHPSSPSEGAQSGSQSEDSLATLSLARQGSMNLPAPEESGVPATHPDMCILRIRRNHLVEVTMPHVESGAVYLTRHPCPLLTWVACLAGRPGRDSQAAAQRPVQAPSRALHWGGRHRCGRREEGVLPAACDGAALPRLRHARLHAGQPGPLVAIQMRLGSPSECPQR